MPVTSTQQEIEELKRRLESLKEQAEDELRQKLAQARSVVADLERQLSDITGRPSASEIKAMAVPSADAAPGTTRIRRPSISDEELKTQILQVLATTSPHGINAKQIATALNQMPARIRQFVANNPDAIKRTGSGPGTKFFLP